MWSIRRYKNGGGVGSVLRYRHVYPQPYFSKTHEEGGLSLTTSIFPMASNPFATARASGFDFPPRTRLAGPDIVHFLEELAECWSQRDL